MVVTDQNQGFPSSPKPVLAVVRSADNIDTLSDWRQWLVKVHPSALHHVVMPTLRRGASTARVKINKLATS